MTAIWLKKKGQGGSKRLVNVPGYNCFSWKKNSLTLNMFGYQVGCLFPVYYIDACISDLLHGRVRWKNNYIKY